jgi:hypothetical protein
MKTTTIPITADTLPNGLHWEADGSCWEAIRCNRAVQGCDWRWRPMNWKAFAKGEPEGEMLDVYLPSDLAERLTAHS